MQSLSEAERAERLRRMRKRAARLGEGRENLTERQRWDEIKRAIEAARDEAAVEA